MPTSRGRGGLIPFFLRCNLPAKRCNFPVCPGYQVLIVEQQAGSPGNAGPDGTFPSFRRLGNIPPVPGFPVFQLGHSFTSDQDGETLGVSGSLSKLLL